MLWSKKMRELLVSIDVYTVRHSHILNKPIILQKNLLGGLFTAVFMIIVFILLTAALIRYLMDNQI